MTDRVVKAGCLKTRSSFTLADFPCSTSDQGIFSHAIRLAECDDRRGLPPGSMIMVKS